MEEKKLHRIPWRKDLSEHYNSWYGNNGGKNVLFFYSVFELWDCRLLCATQAWTDPHCWGKWLVQHKPVRNAGEPSQIIDYLKVFLTLDFSCGQTGMVCTCVWTFWRTAGIALTSYHSNVDCFLPRMWTALHSSACQLDFCRIPAALITAKSTYF